jgi:hypothetical protein
VSGPADPLLALLHRLNQEGVRYILIGGQAVRLNGFVRATEDIDLLLPMSRDNGERIIRALAFLPSAQDLEPAWFDAASGAVENIRVADELLIDLLFAANGETWESLQPHVRKLVVEGVPVVTLDIEGLLKTKTDYRDKDRIDREALSRLLRELNGKR